MIVNLLAAVVVFAGVILGLVAILSTARSQLVAQGDLALASLEPEFADDEEPEAR